MPSLNFKGKALVQNFHLLVPFHELKPVKAKSLTAKPSLHDNLVVHGDNLKALKALLPYYHGAVKCIYIDPPYNTGNEAWVYNDNVNSPMMQDWLVISGDELHKEEMIKLDLHVVNRASTNWRDTMRAAMARRDDLEAKAHDYEGNTNVYIRPICLVQVERTGREQRDGKLIHAEDVREYLIGQGVQKDWVAVKSAEIDELKDFDDVGGLMVRECPIRYIITKQALQEGWDCSFAYVLTILTNPHSKTAMTQLVGRILRQPYARKTHVPALDESYVYCFQRTKLLDEVREGFKREGLEEMAGRIVKDAADLAPVELKEVGPRKQYKAAVENMVLPAFVMRDSKDWRLVSYEADVLSRVRWSEADVSPLYKLELNPEEKRDVELRTGLAVELSGFAKRVREEIAAGGTVQFDFAYAAGHLLDVVPNPWIGYEFVERVFTKLLAKWKGKETVVANNLVFILEELRKQLEAERDRLAETAFNEMLDKDEMRFIVVVRDLGMHRLPKKLEVPKSAVKATRLERQPVRDESVRSCACGRSEFPGARGGVLPGRAEPAVFLVSEYSALRLLRAGMAEVADLRRLHLCDERRGQGQVSQGVRAGNEGAASEEREHGL